MNRRPFTKTFGDLMAEREWSLRELSKRMQADAPPGIHHVTLSVMARGKMYPSKRAMEMIARTMRIRPETFPEYRLEAKRDALDWRKHGLAQALRALGE